MCRNLWSWIGEHIDFSVCCRLCCKVLGCSKTLIRQFRGLTCNHLFNREVETIERAFKSAEQMRGIAA